MNARNLFACALALLVVSCESEAPISPSSAIVEAGWSFGFCLGPCRGELGLAGEALSLRVTDRTGSQVLAQNRGRLTARGAARLEGVAASIPRDILERYGCPDCADGGASWLTILRAGATQRTEYEHGNPPPELAEADAFLAGLMQSLRDCTETPDLTLEPGCVPVS